MAAGLVFHRDFWIRSNNIMQDLVIVQDIYEQDAYKLYLLPRVIAEAKLIVDIGAHIGCFATLIHKLNPHVKIVCVEVCPENVECLRENVGAFAHVIQAACTYEEEELMLLNAVFPNCVSTGGSIVLPKQDDLKVDHQYQKDHRIISKVTLEQIMEVAKEDAIDLLKLDCEGGEFSILGKTPSLDKIKFIVGEYHGTQRWFELVKDKFSTWDYGRMSASDNSGNFHLRHK